VVTCRTKGYKCDRMSTNNLAVFIALTVALISTSNQNEVNKVICSNHVDIPIELREDDKFPCLQKKEETEVEYTDMEVLNTIRRRMVTHTLKATNDTHAWAVDSERELWFKPLKWCLQCNR